MSGAKTAGAPIRTELLEGGRIAKLVVACGKGNVLGRAEIAALRAEVAALVNERSLCALIVGHEGPHFSFGASVPEHLPGEVETMLPALHALARELLALDVFTICAARGACLGGGLELALLCDRIVVTHDAKLGQPEVQLGVFAPIGSALLPHRVGAARAAEMLCSGRTLGSEEAFAIGLVHEVVGADDDPAASALAWAHENLAPKSAVALRLAVHAARRAWRARFEEDLAALEELYLGTLMKTRDAREGLDAFLAKRKPAWEDA